LLFWFSISYKNEFSFGRPEAVLAKL
jgi:hypothetical protein